MAPFDRPFLFFVILLLRLPLVNKAGNTTFYWSAIVNIALYLVLFLSYSTLNYIVTLKSGLDVTQDHSNWYHSEVWVRFPIRLP